MRTTGIFCLFLLVSTVAWADSIRIGTHLIMTGDTAGHVIELIGKPDRKTHAPKKKSEASGERWEYYRDHKTFVVTFRDSAVTTITEHAN